MLLPKKLQVDFSDWWKAISVFANNRNIIPHEIWGYDQGGASSYTDIHSYIEWCCTTFEACRSKTILFGCMDYRGHRSYPWILSQGCTLETFSKDPCGAPAVYPALASAEGRGCSFVLDPWEISPDERAWGWGSIQIAYFKCFSARSCCISSCWLWGFFA